MALIQYMQYMGRFTPNKTIFVPATEKGFKSRTANLTLKYTQMWQRENMPDPSRWTGVGNQRCVTTKLSSQRERSENEQAILQEGKALAHTAFGLNLLWSWNKGTHQQFRVDYWWRAACIRVLCFWGRAAAHLCAGRHTELEIPAQRALLEAQGGQAWDSPNSCSSHQLP